MYECTDVRIPGLTTVGIVVTRRNAEHGDTKDGVFVCEGDKGPIPLHARLAASSVSRVSRLSTVPTMCSASPECTQCLHCLKRQ